MTNTIRIEDVRAVARGKLDALRGGPVVKCLRDVSEIGDVAVEQESAREWARRYVEIIDRTTEQMLALHDDALTIEVLKGLDSLGANEGLRRLDLLVARLSLLMPPT